ncbi:MAG: hypothetical protein ACX98W_01500 [bacterium]
MPVNSTQPVWTRKLDHLEGCGSEAVEHGRLTTLLEAGHVMHEALPASASTTSLSKARSLECGLRAPLFVSRMTGARLLFARDRGPRLIDSAIESLQDLRRQHGVLGPELRAWQALDLRPAGAHLRPGTSKVSTIPVP